MNIQLRRLFDIVGESVDIDYCIQPSELKDVCGYSFAAPVKVKGKIQNRAGVVSLKYQIAAELTHECDRCLTRFNREYCYGFEHIVVAGANSDDEDYVVCQSNVLEMNELAVSDLLLQLPTKILCKDDCKGLCCTCAKNLNEGECDCIKSE